VGAARGGARPTVAPICGPLDIDRGGGGDMLQVGLGQPAVPRRPQPEGAHPLGERALDPGPVGVVVGEGLGLLALTGGLDRLVFSLRVQRQVAR
jgi:hypothetical protein